VPVRDRDRPRGTGGKASDSEEETQAASWGGGGVITKAGWRRWWTRTSVFSRGAGWPEPGAFVSAARVRRARMSTPIHPDPARAARPARAPRPRSLGGGRSDVPGARGGFTERMCPCPCAEEVSWKRAIWAAFRRDDLGGAGWTRLIVGGRAQTQCCVVIRASPV
jgi:hypothetical protein